MKWKNTVHTVIERLHMDGDFIMKKQRIVQCVELGSLLLLASFFAFGTALERQQQDISNKLLRLHVVANSDSDTDQTLKLKVRDAVLGEADVLLQGTDSQEQAKQVLRCNLSRLESAAKGVLTKEGSSQTVEVTLARELFGTRYYDTFALPGGYYDALRVTLGSGNGHNWWCVVYPQICSAAVTDQRTVAVMGGLTEDQAMLLEGEAPEYEFRFRVLELFENMLGWLRTGCEGIPASG